MRDEWDMRDERSIMESGVEIACFALRGLGEERGVKRD